jgi:trans-L-3-hydroxyproline dehydratase
MYGCLLTEPEKLGSDLGVIFMLNEGYSTMCGHGIIALTTVVLETGIIKKEGKNPELRIDTPAGLVIATARRLGGRVGDVSFRNVPSFVYALDRKVNVPGMGEIHYDIAFGGAFYAFCQAEELGINLIPEEFRRLIDAGTKIKKAVMAQLLVKHPFQEDLGFLYGTIITGPAQEQGHHSRNVCIFADGEVDRSPTGTGVSARAALLFARKKISIGEPFTVESLIGTCFTGRVLETVPFGSYEAVIPEVTGSAYLTGRNEFWIDPEDPLRSGFLLR